jgi:hypothetical protein
MTAYLLLCLLGQPCDAKTNLWMMSGPYQMESKSECIDVMMGITSKSGLLENLYDPRIGYVIRSALICGDEIF